MSVFSIGPEVYQDVNLRGIAPEANFYWWIITKITTFSTEKPGDDGKVKLGQVKVELRLDDPLAGLANGYEADCLLSVPSLAGPDKNRKGSGDTILRLLQSTQNWTDEQIAGFIEQGRQFIGKPEAANYTITDAWFLNKRVPGAFIPADNDFFDGFKLVNLTAFNAARAADKRPVATDFDKYARGAKVNQAPAGNHVAGPPAQNAIQGPPANTAPPAYSAGPVVNAPPTSTGIPFAPAPVGSPPVFNPSMPAPPPSGPPQGLGNLAR